MTSPSVTSPSVTSPSVTSPADQECPICGDWVMTGELIFEFPTDAECQRWLCRL
ncbi:MAG: hypothetical protein ACM3ZF_01390 [Mycobacterium leprae]